MKPPTAVLAAGCIAVIACGHEDREACSARVQEEAFALVQAAKACTESDTCEVYEWGTLLGRRGCAPAFACYTVISSRTDTQHYARAARKLASQYESCGSCGRASCAPVRNMRPTCDLDAGRCVLVPGADGGS